MSVIFILCCSKKYKKKYDDGFTPRIPVKIPNFL